MSLDTTFVKAKPIGVYMSDAFPVGQKATRPAPVTITVGTGGAVAGATTLPVEALTAAVKANQILVFNEGDAGEVRLVVTADAAAAAVELSVDAIEGEEGDGIPGDLAAADTATWDRMYRVLGTEQSDYTLTDNTQNLQSATYDSSEAMSWDESEDTSKAWQIARQGRYKPRDHALQQARLAAHEGREVWVKQILPDEDGEPAHSKEGRAKVRGYTEATPAAGMLDASWTFAGQGKPSLVDLP